jgi:phenylacetate-CoA ligase
VAADHLAGHTLLARPFDWWRGADDLWRWSTKALELRMDDHADDDRRRVRRQHRVASLLQHARTNSPLYRAHYRGLAPGCPALQACPPVDRSLLMANFDDWVTDRQVRRADLLDFIADPGRIGEPYLGRYAVWTSSGTTGNPGIYVQDADALALYSALITTRFRATGEKRRWITPASGAGRLAFIAALEGHFAGVVTWERQRRLHPALATRARAFSILQPLPELVAALNEWQPAFVSSYPTMLALLGRERRAGRLNISPCALWCGGEGLTPSELQSIEADFDCPLVEDYGASEAMNMAFACEHGRLHVNDDWFVLEPVDEAANPVAPGQPSASVLVTNLANRVQPLIRYDLNDSVTVLEGACACGSRRPSIRIGGRRDDVLVLDRAGQASGEDEVLRVLPLAIETVLEEEAGIHRFQLTQTGRRSMSLRLDAKGDEEREGGFRRAKKALERFLARQGAAPASLVLDRQPPELDPVSGKLRQVRVLAEARSGGPQ